MGWPNLYLVVVSVLLTVTASAHGREFELLPLTENQQRIVSDNAMISGEMVYRVLEGYENPKSPSNISSA